MIRAREIIGHTVSISNIISFIATSENHVVYIIYIEFCKRHVFAHKPKQQVLARNSKVLLKRLHLSDMVIHRGGIVEEPTVVGISKGCRSTPVHWYCKN